MPIDFQTMLLTYQQNMFQHKKIMLLTLNKASFKVKWQFGYHPKIQHPDFITSINDHLTKQAVSYFPSFDRINISPTDEVSFIYTALSTSIYDQFHPTEDLLFAFYSPSEKQVQPILQSFSTCLYQPLLRQLTERQSTVLRLLAQGYRTKEIAAQLSISSHTVEDHKKALRQKLHCSDTAALIRKAQQFGLVVT